LETKFLVRIVGSNGAVGAVGGAVGAVGGAVGAVVGAVGAAGDA